MPASGLGYNNITGSQRSISPWRRLPGCRGQPFQIPIACDVAPASVQLDWLFFLVIAPTLSEVTLSGLLWSVGGETIGTVVYATQEEGRVLRAAALTIVLIIVLIVINLFIQGLSERSARKGQRLSGGI